LSVAATLRSDLSLTISKIKRVRSPGYETRLAELEDGLAPEQLRASPVGVGDKTLVRNFSQAIPAEIATRETERRKTEPFLF
jgi:hypothetical protein